MWYLAFAPLTTPTVFHFAPLWRGDKAQGNANLTQVFFSK
jgi:hypothetical protein